MRIVSLLPAATEWICEFGAGESLVGRSHECDYPPEVQDRPILTQPTYDAEGDSAAIDKAVTDRVQNGLSLYEVDLERLQDLNPDLIVTQDQCDVCAVSRQALEEVLGERFGASTELFSMQATTLKGVLDEALRLGRTIDRVEEAMNALANLETGLRGLREEIGVDRRTNPESLPSVVCIEWMDPLMVAGHWMPDVVEMAGGNPIMATAGEPSRRVAWEDVTAADPDVLVCVPCGFSVEQTRRDLDALRERDGWERLSAVRESRVALLDGDAYFNRPGPRLYRAIEVLASVVHPEQAIQPAPQPWERQWLHDVPGARDYG